PQGTTAILTARIANRTAVLRRTKGADPCGTIPIRQWTPMNTGFAAADRRIRAMDRRREHHAGIPSADRREAKRARMVHTICDPAPRAKPDFAGRPGPFRGEPDQYPPTRPGTQRRPDTVGVRQHRPLMAIHRL